MTGPPSVAAVIPAHNEADAVGATVGALLATGRLGRVVVVDDGSTDGTAQAARAAGAEVLTLPRNVGKAEALRRGVARAAADLLLLVDADLGASAAHTVRLLDPVLSGEADMAVAGFPSAGRQGGFGLVKRFAGWWIWALTGRRVRHPLSGQRALRRDVWELCRGSVGYGFEVALTIDALRAGRRIVEVPLPLTHRHMGRGLRGFAHRFRQLVHILLTVVRRWFSR